jgi:hypothetical protein
MVIIFPNVHRKIVRQGTAMQGAHDKTGRHPVIKKLFHQIIANSGKARHWSGSQKVNMNEC